jgi:hypothetical protein
VDREGLGPVLAGRDMSVAARNRKRAGSHVLACRPSVIEQHKQDRLSPQLDGRLSQSSRHVRSAASSANLTFMRSARARSLMTRRASSKPQRVHGSLMDARPQIEQWPGRVGGCTGAPDGNLAEPVGMTPCVTGALIQCRRFCAQCRPDSLRISTSAITKGPGEIPALVFCAGAFRPLPGSARTAA